MKHVDIKKLDAGLVAATPQPTGFTYYQNDRNAYEVVVTVGNLEQSLEGCNAFIIWTYEDGSTSMQEAVVEPPSAIRHVISPALLAKAGQVTATLVVYKEADAYRRTLGQWLCRVLPEAEEPAVPPEQPDIPIIQSLLLDAQRVSRETAAALDRAETVEQGAQAARADAKAAQAGAEGAQIKAEAAQCAAEAARDAASTQAATAGEHAAAAAQSAAQAAGHATAAGTAQAGAEAAKSAAQTAQAGAESARDEAETTLGHMVPNTRTVNGKTLDADVTLTAGDVGAAPAVKSCITVHLSKTYSHSVVKWSNIPVPLDITDFAVGGGLTLVNGSIHVGYGINAVWVTGYAAQKLDDVANDAAMIFIRHIRDGSQVKAYETGHMGGLQESHVYYQMHLGPVLFGGLQPGDKIELCVYGGSDPGTIYVDGGRAILTVMEV